MPENTEQAAQAVHDGVHSINPFMKRDVYPKQSIVAYRVSTAVSWLLLVITSFYYSFERPAGHGNTIWGQNEHNRSMFALNSIFVMVYWLILFMMQLGYSWHLYSGNEVYVKAAANVGSHFVVNNLLLFGAIHLWCRYEFGLCLMLLIINFLNLSAAYFRHSTTPRFIHIPVVSGPLAFNYVVLFTVGAIVENPHGYANGHGSTLLAEIFAFVMVWSFMGYGLFFLIAFKDYTMGFAMCYLTTALGVYQVLHHMGFLMWSFAFSMAGVLLFVSLLLCIPGVVGKGPFKRGIVVSEDQERQPLLEDQ